MHVFTYGSLMFDSVWLRVVGIRYPQAEALLHGYKRLKIRDEVYPGLVPASAGDKVRGLVHMNVDETDLTKLDRFEGTYYQRQSAVCIIEAEKSILADIYVVRTRYAHLVVDEPWDPVWFANEGIHQFMAKYKGFQ